MTCLACLRILVTPASWYAIDPEQRRALKATHARRHNRYACAACSRRVSEEAVAAFKDREIAWTGGWVLVRGIRRPVVRGARDVA